MINEAKNIQMVVKKWGLSFSVIQQAMSWKKEHSMGGGDGEDNMGQEKSLLPAKNKKLTRESKCLKKKNSAT